MKTKLRKLTAVFVSIVMLTASIPAMTIGTKDVDPAEPVLISAGTVYCEPGDTVEIPITVSNLNGIEVHALSGKLYYDSEYLTAVSITNGPVISTVSGGIPRNYITEDYISITFLGTSHGFSQDGVYCTITFTVSEDCFFNQPLRLEIEQCYNYPLGGTSTVIPVNTSNGYIYVAGAVDPTAVPPTQVPPTEVPPTEVPPTEVPPTEEPTEGYAVIVFSIYEDVWGDGSGYQMLLDSDANTYGSIIPENGPLTSSGSASDETYAEFEYKIPENADGNLTTSNVIITGQGFVVVPAGTYDWCIVNPVPGDRVWIASSIGSIPGRYDDYTFEANKTYIFTVAFSGYNDRVDLTITEENGEHTVTFLDWDGMILSQQTVPLGGAAAAPPDPAREGYTFIGWNRAFDYVTEDITVTALYEINRYTVTYTGAYTGTDTVEYGADAALPVLEAEGVHYTFTVDGEPWDGTNITSDVTVTVGMEIDVYTVVFYDPIGETVLSTQQVEYYSAASAPEAPEHTGYTFAGWDKEFAHVTSDMTVNAVYDPFMFNVIFTDGFDNIISVQSVAYHTSAEEPDIPVIAGYTFAGWDADFSCIEHDLVVNATWTVTVCTVSFVGVYTATVLVNYGEDCELPVYDSASIHYTFTVDGEPWDGKNVTSDVTVTVGVAANASTFYTVTFLDWDGTVLKAEVVNWGGAATAPEPPARAGYAFVGWDADFSHVTSNLTVTALYEPVGPIEPGLAGDVNCDGAVTMADLSALSAYMLGKAQLTAEGLANADVNGDGSVNAMDLPLIYKLTLNF